MLFKKIRAAPRVTKREVAAGGLWRTRRGGGEEEHGWWQGGAWVVSRRSRRGCQTRPCRQTQRGCNATWLRCNEAATQRIGGLGIRVWGLGWVQEARVGKMCPACPRWSEGGGLKKTKQTQKHMREWGSERAVDSTARPPTGQWSMVQRTCDQTLVMSRSFGY